MKLKVGDKIEKLDLPSTDGTFFNLKEIKGKKTLITFYRFATCPFCNLRINEIIKRYDELDKNFKIVAIFDAPLDYLTETMKKHNAPFTILADEEFKYFKQYDVEQSLWKFIIGSTVGFFKIFRAFSNGYFPLQLKSMTTVPVDILINKNGIIDKVFYGRHTIDHLTFEEIKEFSSK